MKKIKAKGIIFDMDGTILDSMHIWRENYDYNSLSRNYNGRVFLKDGALDFLNALRAAKIKMVLATATDREFVLPALRHNKIADYFETIFTCGEVGSEKHTPLIYYKALEFLGLEKSEVLVFEDAHYAVKTAKEAGFKVVGVYDKWAYHKEEIEALSDLYIKSFNELTLGEEE